VSKESEATEERITTDPGEEDKQESENDEPKETAKAGRRWQQGRRGEEGEHQTGKKERKMTRIVWVWASLGLVIDCPKTQCVVCSEVLENSCLKPSYLRRHLHTKHANVIQKPLTFFKIKTGGVAKTTAVSFICWV